MQQSKFRKFRTFFTAGQQMLANTNPRFKLSLIGLIVGVTSGLAAIGLNFSLKYLHDVFRELDSDLWKILLPVLGLFATIIVLKYIIKDFEGHGLPEVIHAISLKGGNVKFRSSFSKLLGSLLTIATGGSAGPEAPVAVSGAAIGSNFARLFKADEKIKIAVTGSGAAAAIAAIFNAPITGIIFTMEVIIGDWASIYMLPVAIASVTGTEISRLLNGNQIPFAPALKFVSVFDIGATIGLAVFCAVISILFIKILRNSAKYLERYLPNTLMKAIAGGLIVGLISFKIPVIRGEGYEFVQHLVSGHFASSAGFIFLVILLKIAATSITLGAGGAGGVFAPSLVIGSASGYVFCAILNLLFPGTPLNKYALFALVGMAGVISGTLNAPLTGMFLIIEITGGYDAILPLLLVAFLTSALVKIVEKHSIYHYELVKKGFLHRPRTDGRILADIQPLELLEQDLITVPPELLLRDIIPTIKKSKRNYFPVVDKRNARFCGMVYFNDLKEFIFNPEMLNTILVEEIMHADLTTIKLSDNLLEIQNKFEMTNSWSLPVVEEGKFKGLISKATMLDLYRKELRVQTEN